MYINRCPEEIFKLAGLAYAVEFFENRIKALPARAGIKRVAAEEGVSEKQLHFWKNLLIKEGPKIYSFLKPGRRRENLSSHSEEVEILAAETVNHIVVGQSTHEGKNRKFSPETKEDILRQRDRLKEEHSIPYERFAELVGIDSGSTRLWSRKVRQEGREGLEDRSRAPKRRPRKLPPDLINKVVGYGRRWKSRHRGRIELTEFGARFRWKYWRLLARYGRTNLSDKTIGRYLKEAGLYEEKEERPRGKRGAYRYYFPGAQFLTDTVVLELLGIKAKVIAVMDALSRKIFHQEAFLSESARDVIRSVGSSLKNATRIGLKVVSVLSDHGRSYKASRVWEYLKGRGIFRIFSAPYWPEGKAPLERYFRTLREGLSNRWQVFLYLVKGILLWVRDRVALRCLNLILIGFNDRYEKTPNPYIDGKSPRERGRKEVSREYQEAARLILEERERESMLKAEFIAGLCDEFGWCGKMKGRVKKYLSHKRKEFIEVGAQALRRKVVSDELTLRRRWYYLSKVIENKERERKESELAKAEGVIRQEEIKAKEGEEKQRILKQRRWYEAHPEEALEEAVEWLLGFWEKAFDVVRRHYETAIRDNLMKVLMHHSRITAGIKVEKICKRIEDKNSLENKEVIKSGLSLPCGDKLKEAKYQIISVIRQSYSECREEIPAFHGLRQLWRGAL